MQLIRRFFFASFVFFSSSIFAQDLSGQYDCVGQDLHEGEFKGSVTIQIQPDYSNQQYQSYSFELSVPDFGVYRGFAAGEGMDVGIYFALEAKANEDYGVATAKFFINKDGNMAFKKFYYEPNYKGGNTGTEECVRLKNN